jgi:hypothetical protein
MGLRLGKICTVGALVLWAAMAFAHNHRALNGTWTLLPSESNFAGQHEIQNGTLTINDREGNIYVMRNFSYEDDDHRIVSYEFGADGPENSTVRDGKVMKTKARWDGDVLKVTTLQDGHTTVERFSLTPRGNLMVVVDREGMGPITLMFRRAG